MHASFAPRTASYMICVHMQFLWLIQHECLFFDGFCACLGEHVHVVFFLCCACFKNLVWFADPSLGLWISWNERAS